MLKKQIRQNADPSIKPFRISNSALSLGVTAIAIVIYVSFIAVLLPLTNNNLYGLYGFSQELTHAGSGDSPWREHVHPKPGYDGQFYFRLALDPFTDKREAFGVNLDAPLMRQQRILLPFFTWLIARGDPTITPPVMMAINLAAVAGCAFASSLLLSGLGISAWYGLLFALYPGFAVSVGRFLTEPLTLFMIFLSLLMLVRRKNLAASILLSLAVFSRETATLVVAAGFFTWLTRKHLRNGTKDYFSPHVSFWLYPTLAFLLWQLWLYCNWSSLLFDNATSSNLGPPFVGFFRAICENITKLNPATGFYLMMTSAVVAYQVFLSRTILRAPLLLLISWICYLLLATCIGIAQWRDSPGFLRILAELNMLGLLAYVIVKKRPGKVFVSFWLVAWLLTAGAEWYHLYLVQETLSGKMGAAATGIYK
jgi:hypothetical protein